MKEENPEETIPAVTPPQTVDADMLLAAEAQAVDDVEKDAYEGHDSGVAVAEDDFDNLGIEPPILKAVKELGFVHPMPIQRMVIPHLLHKDGDVVGLAQTGTGKTAAFGIPVLQRTDASHAVPQSLIIAPTRELCLQIAGDLADFAKYIDGVRILPVYGGSSIESQIRTLRKGVQVVVATPGRLIDLIKRRDTNSTKLPQGTMHRPM